MGPETFLRDLDARAQCDPATTLMPANLMFLGPALFVKIGELPRLCRS